MLDPLLDAYGQDKPLFQQDNARPHVAGTTMAWFQEKNVDLLPWPANSDLNIMENVFGILARRIYANGRQFYTVEELRDTIEEEWDRFGQSTIDALIDSIPHRVFQVIERHGLSVDALLVVFSNFQQIVL